MRLTRLALLVAAGLVALAFAGVLQPTRATGQAGDPSPAGLTVTGTGTSTATPDRASFSFGVVAQARTAAAALSESAEAAARVVAALQRAGVARADVQTSEVSLSPRMAENGETIVGYTATNAVTATVRRLASAGSVVDAAVGAGANQVWGPNLLASDQDAAYREALREAVAHARTKAQTLAAAAGGTVGRITAIVESGATPMPLAEGTRAADSAPQIEPGTQEIVASVSVTFALG